MSSKIAKEVVVRGIQKAAMLSKPQAAPATEIPRWRPTWNSILLLSSLVGGAFGAGYGLWNGGLFATYKPTKTDRVIERTASGVWYGVLGWGVAPLCLVTAPVTIPLISIAYGIESWGTMFQKHP